MMKRIVFTIVCIKLLGQTLVLRPRQKTVLSLGHVNGKIKFTFTIGAGIPERPSWQYFAREPPCTVTILVLHKQKYFI